MKVFITGATGFIGKHLVNKLIVGSNQVTINLYGNENSPFDNKVKTYRLSEDNINKDIQFFKEESFDGVIHLASLYITSHSPEDVSRLVDSNLRFSTHVLECSSQARMKWFLNTGTYWQHYRNSDYSPVNLYAATKQAFESIAQYYIESNQILFCTLKLSDTYGPGDTRPKIFNLWNEIALNGQTLEMSPGEQQVNITYIDDIISAFVLLSDHLNNKYDTIFNGSSFAVNGSKIFSLKELALVFEKVTGVKLNIIWGAKQYREREIMVPWDKGVNIPGWKPMVSIEQGIQKTFKITNESL